MIRSVPRLQGAFATCAHAHLYHTQGCIAILLWEVLTAVTLEASRAKQQHSSVAVAGKSNSSVTVTDAVREPDMPGK